MAQEDPQRAEEDADDFRCPCGRLLARRQDEGVNVKCPRCKRSCRICRIDGSCEAESRCECGRLIARLSSADAELRCPRCKRFVLVALAGAWSLSAGDDGEESP